MSQVNVGRLDVAVHEALVVGEVQGVADLRHRVDRRLGVEALPLDELVEVSAFHELHDDVVMARVGLPEVVDLDDVRVIELRHRLRLALEALFELRAGAHLGR